MGAVACASPQCHGDVSASITPGDHALPENRVRLWLLTGGGGSARSAVASTIFHRIVALQKVVYWIILTMTTVQLDQVKKCLRYHRQ